MAFRRKITAVASLSLAIVIVALVLAGCGGTTPATTTTSPTVSTTSPAPATTTSSSTTTSSPPTTSVESTTSSAGPVASAERQAAEAYLTAMTPTFDKDYSGSQWFEQAFTQWVQSYGNTDLTTNRKAWNAVGALFEEALPKEQEIIRAYEAVTPPPAFQAAHAALLANNREGSTWATEFIAALKAKRPISELMATLSAGPPGPSNVDVLAAFRAAAAQAGVDLPTGLINAYTDPTDPGGLST
jgi:hypothetical protein